MKYFFHNANESLLENDCLILGIYENQELSSAEEYLNKQSKGKLKKILAQGDVEGKLGQTSIFYHVQGMPTNRVLLVGLGEKKKLTPKDFRTVIQACARALSTIQAKRALHFLMELEVEGRDTFWNLRQLVMITEAVQYSFDVYKSKKTPVWSIKEIGLAFTDRAQLSGYKQELNQVLAIVSGVSYTKNLANQPSNICTPSYLANQAIQLSKQFKAIKTTILEEKDMKKIGMGAFLAVSKGSHNDAKLVCLEYKGAAKAPTIALVGKGITFDTGGISLKPAESMVGMKYDMCGAATVLGVMKAVAELKLPIHLVGLLATAENMPGGAASKPEDIVSTLSGQTVEIMNTDAEGRLVLCDALTYCERYKPDTVIDIATLTGAVVIALGPYATGLLANNQDLAADLLRAGEETYDRAWQLPLWDEYQDMLKSPFADISNVGGRMAGTITAGSFLARFAKKFRWAHLDVAGTAAMMGGAGDRHATGRPVPLLVQYLINRAQN